MGRNVADYFVEPKIGNFIFSFGHPMKPIRINMVNELIRAYGLENWLNIKNGKNISFEEIENFHQDFTHCYLLTFDSEESRDSIYTPHPQHRAFVASLQPHVEKVFVVDYWTNP